MDNGNEFFFFFKNVISRREMKASQMASPFRINQALSSLFAR